MSVQELLEQFNLFDSYIVSHGFTDYHFDYRIQAELDSASGPKGRYEFLFRKCAIANYEGRIPPTGYSSTRIFTEYERWQEPDELVWAVRAVVQPGWQLISDSESAMTWAERLGIAMHEIPIETTVFTLRLVFHDLAVKPEEAQPYAR